MASSINASTAGVGGVITTADNSGVLNIQTAGTTAITVDASQNVGVGVTPSAWGTSNNVKALQIPGGSIWSYSSSPGNIYIGNNYYFNGTNRLYSSNGAATEYSQQAGQHIWYTAASGTAGNTVTFTQAMTLDASSNLTVNGYVMTDGFSSPTTRYYSLRSGFAPNATGGVGMMAVDLGTGNSDGLRLSGQQGILFSTGATERMRLDASGNLLVGTSSAFALGTFVKNQTSSTPLMYVSNTNNTAGNGVYQSVLGANCNTNNSFHLYATTGTSGYYLLGNGTSTFSSDERLKKNIESTRDGYIDDLCKLRVVKYNWNNHEEGTPKEIGLIAQEVEQVFPGLVQDALHPSEDGIAYKTLKASVLPFMLLKAIQEQQAMIEELKAEVDLLKGAK